MMLAESRCAARHAFADGAAQEMPHAGRRRAGKRRDLDDGAGDGDFDAPREGISRHWPRVSRAII